MNMSYAKSYIDKNTNASKTRLLMLCDSRITLPQKQAKRLKAYLVQSITVPTLGTSQRVEQMCEAVDKVLLRGEEPLELNNATT